MNWDIIFLPEAEDEYLKLDGSQRIKVTKLIERVIQNPLPASEGGYGKPLGNKGGINLTGFLKIKLRASGIRVVYKAFRQNNEIVIVVIGLREEYEVYDEALRRAVKYNL